MLINIMKNLNTKGIEGEYLVLKTLGANIINEKYVINNIILTDEFNNSTQIDHILIIRSGIYVIETKNLSGLITGKSDEYYWYQQTTRRRVKFYNPIIQNENHIKFIKRILKMENNIESVVVFPKAKLKIENSSNTIIGKLKLIKHILNTDKESVFNENEINNIYNKINDYKINKRITKKKHIKNVKQATSFNVCPLCNFKLVIIKSKYGKFYGCSNYPNCKFIKK